MLTLKDGEVRRDGEFLVVEQLAEHLGLEKRVAGYNIRGPGSDPTWLYSEEQVAPKARRTQGEARQRSTVGVKVRPALGGRPFSFHTGGTGRARGIVHAIRMSGQASLRRCGKADKSARLPPK